MVYRGFFSRRDLTIRSYFYPDSVDVTDIDVIGVRFSDNFQPEVTICECKSGRNSGTVDRILWMKGLSNYLKADNSMLAKPEIKSKIKNFANELGVIPVDSTLLEEMEKNNAIPDEWLGSFDYDNYETKLRNYYLFIRTKPKLSKVYWFLKSSFWFENNITRLKQCLTALDVLVKQEETESKKWLIYESTILFSVSMIWLCHETKSFTNIERENYISDMLTTGLGSKDKAKKILDATFGVIAALMKEKGVEPSLIEYENLQLTPPEYTKPLIDLIERCNNNPKEAIQVPRFLDFICYEFLMKETEIDLDKLKKLFPDSIDLIAKLTKNIVNFVMDQKNVPQNLFEAFLKF